MDVSALADALDRNDVRYQEVGFEPGQKVWNKTAAFELYGPLRVREPATQLLQPTEAG